MKKQFDHEKLDVYQDAISFVSWVDELLVGIPKSLAVYDQLDKSSTAIPLNIAIGRGKFTPADRAHYLNVAHDAALECAACLDVLIAKHRIDSAEPGKTRILKIVAKLEDLISRKSSYPSDGEIKRYVL